MEFRIVLSEETFDENDEQVTAEESALITVNDEDVYFLAVVKMVRDPKVRYDYAVKWAKYTEQERKDVVTRLLNQQGDEIREFFKEEYLRREKAKHAI